jgi:PTS system fructose-specific IIA component/PTS system nitrogen regulatory IIA component
MKLSDFVVRDAIVPDLKADTKEAVVREMVASLQGAGHIAEADYESIVKAIMKREELGSTGIGNGIAVPHTKHPSVNRLLGSVALSKKGVEFSSLDGEPAYIVFLVISPPDRPGDHLRALENISRQLRNDSFCRFLRQANSADDIRELLEEADNNQFSA